MDIYLIRHTKTDTAQGLCYGRSEVPLASTFSEEAEEIHGKLIAISSNCLVYSSPLQRCVTLAETFEKPVHIDERLKEVDFGDWENRFFNDIDDELLRKWTESFVIQPPPNGESFSDLCRRVSGFWNELLLNAPTSNHLLIVTHAGVIRALFAHILELPLENAFKLRVDPGSIHKIRYENNYTYLDYTNR